jgi:hypothetical protein
MGVLQQKGYLCLWSLIFRQSKALSLDLPFRMYRVWVCLTTRTGTCNCTRLDVRYGIALKLANHGYDAHYPVPKKQILRHKVPDDSNALFVTSKGSTGRYRSSVPVPVFVAHAASREQQTSSTPALTVSVVTAVATHSADLTNPPGHHSVASTPHASAQHE